MSGGRSVAHQDFRAHRSWLLACDAVLEQAFNDRLAIEAPTDEERFAMSFDMLVLCQGIKDCIDFAASRMDEGDEREQTTVAEMLGHYRRALAALPTVARHVEVADRAVRVADERRAGKARKGRVVNRDARLDVARPRIVGAKHKAAEGAQLLNFKRLLAQVNDDLKAAELSEISEATLRRYATKV